MDCKTITFFVLVLSKYVTSVKVNLQGQITLGKEVMETLSHLIDPGFATGRRSMSSHYENQIAKEIISKEICSDIPFCSSRSSFVDNYLIILSTGIDNILKTSATKDVFKRTINDRLDNILRDCKKILQSADTKISESSEFYYWNSVLKKISSKFHNFVSYNLIDNYEEAVENGDNKYVFQKLVTAIVLIEHKFENKLCTEHKICIKSFVCTKALQRILEKLTSLPESDLRSFMKSFYEALFATTFYSSLSIATTREFQLILNNLAFSNNISAKELLQSVKNSVEARLELIASPNDKEIGYDVLLIHMILSDLDHFYSKHNQFPFYNFVKNFISWTTDGGLKKQLRTLMNDIGYEIKSQSHDLPLKITNEVRVFLELTVDP